MSLEDDLAFSTPDNNTLLTIGVFDGLHLGHKALLAELVKQAKEKKLASGVVTFKQHPRNIINTSKEVPFLTNLPLKINLIKNEGVNFVVPLTFTPEIARINAAEFISLLQKYLKMKDLLIGPDFALGHNRKGNIESLRMLGDKMNFTLTVFPVINKSGNRISSTGVRNAIAAGDMKQAYDLLGRYFSIEGEVVEGTGTGKKLGFPTANLNVDTLQALPMEGVYATQASFNGQTYNSVTFIGKRSTFGDTRRTIETHFIDYNDDLYHKILKIDMIYRLRGEIKFNSGEELTKQINKDVIKAREVLNRIDRK